MALESGTYISDLVPTNPAHTDGVNQADSHLRLIKSTLQATFPNVAGAVSASHTALNAIAAAFANAGSIILSGATPATLTNSSGALVASGTLAAPFVAAGGRDVGTSLVPVGGIIAWSGSVAAIPSTWALCDGTKGTPDLRGKFVLGAGGAYPVGYAGGAASVQTDAQGSHNHTGYTAGSGNFSVSVQTDSQGGHSHGGSTQGYTLGIADIPAHTHQQAQSVQAVLPSASSGTNMNVTSLNGQSSQNGPYTAAAGNGNAHAHPIGTDGVHTHGVTVSQGSHTHAISVDGTHTHNVSVLPPYYALCFIMKL